MIYKRGCNKNGPNGSCSKCGERGSCGVYWYKFMWQGKLIRKSTKQGNDKVARQMESAHRTALAKGEVGIRERKAAPTLKEFLKQEFLPYVETRHAAKHNTMRYYADGSAMLMKSELAGLRLDELTDQHAQQFARQHSSLSPSGINRGLRTLRRALNLAFQWKSLDKPVKFTLATGERQRDRVLDEKRSRSTLTLAHSPGGTAPQSSWMKGSGLAKCSRCDGRTCSLMRMGRG